MTEISMLDKLKVVLNITKSDIFYPIIILFLIFISFLFITTNKNNAKESKKTYGALYAICIIIILIRYAGSLKDMLSYMMDNLFIVFYFPNIAVYLGAIIVTNIIMWISMFSTKTKKSIKVLNSVTFSIMHYLFIITLNIINTKKIDVFDQTSLYGNVSIHSLIELSSNIFLIWIIFLTVYKIIKIYLESKKTEKVYDSKELKVEHVTSPEKENLILHLPDSVEQTQFPYIVKRDMSNPKIIYELPKQTENTAVYEQMLTLDDYKLLVSLLKEEKTKDVKKILSNRNRESIQQKEPEGSRKTENENRLSELMALYKSTN